MSERDEEIDSEVLAHEPAELIGSFAVTSLAAEVGRDRDTSLFTPGTALLIDKGLQAYVLRFKEDGVRIAEHDFKLDEHEQRILGILIGLSPKQLRVHDFVRHGLGEGLAKSEIDRVAHQAIDNLISLVHNHTKDARPSIHGTGKKHGGPRWSFEARVDLVTGEWPQAFTEARKEAERERKKAASVNTAEAKAQKIERLDQAVVERLNRVAPGADTTLDALHLQLRRHGLDVTKEDVEFSVLRVNKREFEEVGHERILGRMIGSGGQQVTYYRPNPLHPGIKLVREVQSTSSPVEVLRERVGKLFPQGMIINGERLPFSQAQRQLIAIWAQQEENITAYELARLAVPTTAPSKALNHFRAEAEKLIKLLFEHGHAARVESGEQTAYRLYQPKRA